MTCPHSSKKHPFGGLKCLESIFGPARCPSLIYIGDHEADVQFARHLQGALGEQSRVISVAVAYSRATPERWEHQPDHIARDVEDLLHRRAISVTPVADCRTE